MGSDKVTVDGRALISWYQLPAAVQSQVLETLGKLAGTPPEKWPGGRVERWWPGDDLYALHVWVGADELLVFFRPEGGRIRVDSMMLKETIERYSVKKP
jgi:hypothetical protein